MSSQSSEGLKRDAAEAVEGLFIEKGKFEYSIFAILWFDVSSRYDKIDATTNVVMSGDCHPFWLTHSRHIVQQNVGDVFVEMTFVAKAPQVLLDAFRFKTQFVGRVLDGNLGEIGLIGQRTNGGEFVGVETNCVIVVRVRVGKRLDGFRRKQCHSAA